MLEKSREAEQLRQALTAAKQNEAEAVGKLESNEEMLAVQMSRLEEDRELLAKQKEALGEGRDETEISELARPLELIVFIMSFYLNIQKI